LSLRDDPFVKAEIADKKKKVDHPGVTSKTAEAMMMEMTVLMLFPLSHFFLFRYFAFSLFRPTCCVISWSHGVISTFRDGQGLPPTQTNKDCLFSIILREYCKVSSEYDGNRESYRTQPDREKPLTIEVQALRTPCATEVTQRVPNLEQVR